MLKNKLKYILLSLLITSSAWNAYYSVINFIATNLSIRESFYFTNDVNKKGTHWGGEDYRLTTRRHKLELVKFKFLDIISSFSEVNNIDPHNSNFEKEYQLISLLFFLEKKSNLFKKNTALYIPKTLDVYWDLSCDSHMTPFVAPAITNMAMIEGLPMKDLSCYKHFFDYGYSTYNLNGRKAKFSELTPNQICERAKEEGFLRVIEIRENEMGDIITLVHECTTLIDSI